MKTLENPFLFACGVPRSGTTLLQRMLNSHPSLAVVNDSHFIPRSLERTNKSLINQAAQGLDIELTPELVRNVFEYRRFVRMGFSDVEFQEIQNASVTYQELVSKLYEAYARKQDKQFAGEKTPDFLRRLSLLHSLFPNAKLIHLVRDGRNVALSLLQWANPKKGPGRIRLWEQHPVAVCALWWNWLVNESRIQSATIPKDYYVELRYESIVNNPATEMQKVCEFLDLEYSSQMLDYHRGKSKPQQKLSAKSAWLPPQAGLRNWKNDMTVEQIELFELLASDGLNQLGYPLHTPNQSRKSKETAKFCSDWWEQNFANKHPTANSQDTSNVESRHIGIASAAGKRRANEVV